MLRLPGVARLGVGASARRRDSATARQAAGAPARRSGPVFANAASRSQAATAHRTVGNAGHVDPEDAPHHDDAGAADVGDGRRRSPTVAESAWRKVAGFGFARKARFERVQATARRGALTMPARVLWGADAKRNLTRLHRAARVPDARAMSGLQRHAGRATDRRWPSKQEHRRTAPSCRHERQRRPPVRSPLRQAPPRGSAPSPWPRFPSTPARAPSRRPRRPPPARTRPGLSRCRCGSRSPRPCRRQS